MFCKQCGQQLVDEAVVCPHCGVATGHFPQVVAQGKSRTSFILFGALLGLIGLPGIHTTEPTFGLPATWIEPAMRDEAGDGARAETEDAGVLAEDPLEGTPGEGGNCGGERRGDWRRVYRP